MAESVASDHQADDVLSLESASSIASMSDLGDAAEEVRASGAAVAMHHEEFYLEDELVKLQAGDVVYRVHAHFFMKESDEARVLVKRAAMAADRLLVLDNVASEDLEAFLKVLYCRIFESSPLSFKAEWVSVLHLAHTWNFESMRAYAIGKLAALTTPVDRIVLGKKYAIDHWLHSAYRVVCERQACLSDEEGARLGLADVLRISRTRQDMRIPALLRSSETKRSHAFYKTFGIPAPIPITSAALRAQFESPVMQDEPMTSVAVTSTLRAPTQPTHVINSAIDVSGEIITTSERDCTTPQPPDDDEPSESDLTVLAPISRSVRTRLQKALAMIENADEETQRSREALEKAELGLKDAETALGSAKAVNMRCEQYELYCATARARVDDTRRVITSYEKSTEQAHSALVSLALADVTVELRPYEVPADMLTDLSQLLSTIDSTREALLNVRREELASKALIDGDDAIYIKSWKRMHTNNPTTDTAQALEDGRRQVELSKVRCTRKIADAEDVIARSQRKLAQLLTQLAVAATSS